jgi:Uncharacterized protein related to capsule biosynthesis enzymes
MNSILKVSLWGEEIGRLAWDKRRQLSYFTYNPAFVGKGIDVAPIVAPLNEINAMRPLWGENEKIYQKLPAFIADSLPDAWGNQIFEFWRTNNHLAPSEITPIEKLSFIGKRGMGALEFEPEISHAAKTDKIDMHSLINLAQRIFTDRENATIHPDESLTMQSLLTVGTSAGGRLPKAIIAIHRETGEIRSGQISGLQGYDYCIMKFGNAKYCSTELEQTYYELAVDCGISMMPSRLISIEGQNHFLTQRFDRVNGEKIHTQTLAAICPEADSYEKLMWVCRKLRTPESDCEEVFRRMVFNYLMNNSDDHSKNFSFTMNRNGEWRISPAYDMTYVIDTGGYQPNRDHCLYMRAKLSGVTKEDVLSFAKDNGIRRAEAIIRSVVTSAQKFRKVAKHNGVSQEWIGRVETCIRKHISDWGYAQESQYNANYESMKNIHIEQAYKGNIHLLATINGEERKYIIRKGTTLYVELTEQGLSNISTNQLIRLAKQYLV